MENLTLSFPEKESKREREREGQKWIQKDPSKVSQNLNLHLTSSQDQDVLEDESTHAL